MKNKTNTLFPKLKEHLETLLSIESTNEVTGYCLLVTTRNPRDKSNTGSFTVYDSIDYVHLLGFVDLIHAKMRDEMKIIDRAVDNVYDDVDNDNIGNSIDDETEDDVKGFTFNVDEYLKKKLN